MRDHNTIDNPCGDTPYNPDHECRYQDVADLTRVPLGGRLTLGAVGLWIYGLRSHCYPFLMALLNREGCHIRGSRRTDADIMRQPRSPRSCGRGALPRNSESMTPPHA